ncbi:MAG: Serine/threonine-protein kinase [Vezdaea aestivalis]|nr:MAG: Serine/threonine-protein kinase [Vezdaea aestivalis]
MDPHRLGNNQAMNSGNGQGGGQGNRPYLHLDGLDRAYQGNDRAYPTTPSTFPQPSPAFGNQGGQQNYAAGQGQYGPGYFVNQQYPQQQQYAQPMSGGYQHQQGLQAPQAAYGGRAVGYNMNDGTNGLVHQFSHQNLGGAASNRQANYGRQQNAPPRPRTAGNTGQAQYNNSHMHQPMPAPIVPTKDENEVPERLPDKYSAKVKHCGGMTGEFVSNFFKENVTRARERNERQVGLENYLSDPQISESRKDAKKIQTRRAEAEFLRFLRTKEVPGSFTTLKVIGKGAFGEVKLVQKKLDGKIYALKSLVKTEMFKKDQLAHVRSERDILAESDSPWVVKLFTTFQDNTFLYMLMEFLPGGDLMTMLIKYEIFTEDITRFYIAEIVCAIDAVHKLGYIHRDIKPDNILLDRKGHIKLTDFGLSTGFHKQHENSYYQQLLNGKSANRAKDRNSVSLDQINLTVSNRPQVNTWRKSRRLMAYSTVGTPDYIAPEIFGGHGYTYDCDWWSLGTIMFECLVGWPPFCAEDPHDTYRKIVAWRETLYFPEDIRLGSAAENLIRSLVCDTANRLGSGGAQEIRAHPFFKGVQWDLLRKIRAPFEPKLSSNVDTAYFPTDEIDQTDNAAALRAQTVANEENNAEMSLPFVGYTYKRFDAFRGQ